MRNGAIWQDTEGRDIQAHGGCIIKHGDVFYWYGENKDGENKIAHFATGLVAHRVDVIGISCYSSSDLLNWKYEGLVLEADRYNPESPLHTSKVLERPKVIYNEKNHRFVLWVHLDNAEYSYAGVGVAVSDSPTGPFEFKRAFVPNNQDSRDMTVYKDSDGTAYLVHSKDRNKTMNIARLTDDYEGVDGLSVSVLVDQARESPTVFFDGGVYYMITSGCTGWDPNPALYATSGNMLGKWRLIDNPCTGVGRETTYDGQASFVFEAEGRFYLMLDHWIPENLRKSGYSILPIKLDGRGHVSVAWQDEWQGM